MTVKKFDYAQVPLLSGRDVAYIEEIQVLRPFYKYPVDLAAFAQVMADKKQDPIDRAALVAVLKKQYQKFSPSPVVAQQIEKLAQENTFTVVTAHQPSLFTGPLYYIFKIVSAINLAKKLNETYPDSHVVPVFITSGEDHDFAEVNHLHLFGRTLAWESGETGPVGQMKTASLAPVIELLRSVLGNSEHAAAIARLVEETHTQHLRYDDAAFALAHELFKDDGLVVLNTNDAQLKQLFVPAIKMELFEQPSFHLVNQTIGQLEKVGFPSQATPREINFFYMGDQLRERIVAEGDQYKVLNTNLLFSKAEMAEEIELHPERFSPNVVMRPIFQEMVLPNLAYIGGGGELAYWLERKAQFQHFGLNFPMLVRRNSAMWVDPGSSKKMEKLGLSVNDLWNDADLLVRAYLAKNAKTALSLAPENEQLTAVFQLIADKAEQIDPTLVKTVWAEHAKTLKSLEGLETRILRAEKHKHETALQQIKGLRDKLFPGNGLQERHENFMQLYSRMGGAFLETLKANFDPLEKQFLVFEE